MKFKLRNNHGLSKCWTLAYTKAILDNSSYYSIIFKDTSFSRMFGISSLGI